MRCSIRIDIQSPLCFLPLLLVNILEYAAEAVQGCSVFFAPDFKWKRAICDSDSPRLTHIPHDLPTNLIDLRVKQQLIPLVSSKGLMELIHLETLQIESSGVVRVTMDAFRSLNNLKHLNLRNNSLHLGINGLPKEALQSLPQLRTLDLADNPIDLVPDSFFVLSGGSHLQNLLLGPTKGVSMYVDPGAFTSLHKLQLLDLSFTKMTSLPANLQHALDEMTELSELYLGGNPWHCDCKLRWLNRWFRKRRKTNIQFTKTIQNYHGQQLTIEPICTTPDVIRDRPIFSHDLNDHSFQCTPKIITESQNVSVIAGEISTLSCEFYADPVSPVLWFKNGHQLYNSTRVSITQRITDETFVSFIQVSFDASDDGTKWSCAIHNNENSVRATFQVTVKPGELTIQNSWIYAGIGSGTLFILLTAFGVAIFYCCDPRSHPEQTINRWIRKGKQVERIRGCYGCHKPGILFTNPKEPPDKSEVGDGNVAMKSQQQLHSDPSNPPNSPLRQIYSSSTTLASPIARIASPVIRLNHAEPKLSSLGGSLIRETVSTGENRLLVSCDGPEPTVLLATRIPTNDGMESPPSVYGLTGPLNYEVPPPVISTSQEQLLKESHEDTFPGYIPQSTLQPHIYARVNHPSAVRGNSPLTTPIIQYSTPCPVHGSISFDRTTFPRPLPNEEQYLRSGEKREKPTTPFNAVEGTTSYNYDGIYSSPMKQSSNQNRHSETTQVFSYAERLSSPDSTFFEHSKQNNLKLNYSQSSLTQREETIDNEDNVHDTMRAVRPQNKYYSGVEFGEKKTDHGKVVTFPVTLIQPSYPGQHRTSVTDSTSQDGLRMPSHHMLKGVLHTNLQFGSTEQYRSNKNFNTLQPNNQESSSTTSKEPSDRSCDSNHSSSSSENNSPRTAPSSNWWAKPTRLYRNSSNPYIQAVRPKSSCAVHYPTMEDHGHDLTSPESGSTRSAYCISTLPPRFQKPLDVQSLILRYATSNRDVRRPFGASRSTHPRPLIRPGSKHKLDTDSGTDYNE